jgi:dsRNA-specific ribonuclease
MCSELRNNYRDDDIIKTEEGLIFNPYNPLNVKITLSEVQSILSKYNVVPTVFNIELYQRAFVHESYTKRPILENSQKNITIVERPSDCLPLSTKSNQRLEFLGDGILEAVTKYYLYRRFAKEDEGFMTNKKIMIVKNESIGRIALEMGLNKWLLLSKHSEEKLNRTNLKKLGCLFEAFIGALFLDFNKLKVNGQESGFTIAQQFIENVFDAHIDWVKLIQEDDNYKNLLQVKIQKEFKMTPDYLIIENNNDIGYKMGVYLCLGQKIYSVKPEEAMSISSFVNLQSIKEYVQKNKSVFILMGQGQHKIKTKAEQMACFMALQTMVNF